MGFSVQYSVPGLFAKIDPPVAENLRTSHD